MPGAGKRHAGENGRCRRAFRATARPHPFQARLLLTRRLQRRGLWRTAYVITRWLGEPDAI